MKRQGKRFLALVIIASLLSALIGVGPVSAGTYFTTHPEASKASPALAVFQGEEWAAFIGKSTNHIYVCSSADGINWSNHNTIFEDKSVCPPSLAVFNNNLYLAFTGDATGSINIVYYDGTKWHYAGPTGQTSAAGPTLAVFGDKLYLAFIASNGSNDLMLCSSSDGSNWSHAAPIPGQSSQSNPSLVTCGGRLWLAYMGNSSHQLYTWSTTDPDNANWSPTRINETSCAAPSLAADSNGNLWIVFAGDTTKDIFFCSYDAGSDKWSGHSFIVGQKSQIGAALIFVDVYDNGVGTLLNREVVFVSMDGSDTLHICSSADGINWSDVGPMEWNPQGLKLFEPDKGFGSGVNNCNFNAELDLDSNGTCTYTGNYNNTGGSFLSPTQNYSVAIAVSAADGKIFTFEHQGTCSCDTYDDWSTTVQSPIIASEWPEIISSDIPEACKYDNNTNGCWVFDSLEDAVNEAYQLYQDYEELEAGYETAVEVFEIIAVVAGSPVGMVHQVSNPTPIPLDTFLHASVNPAINNILNSSSGAGASASQGIQVYANGTLVPMDMAPKFVDGRFLAQMRPLFQALGANDPQWDQKTKTITDTMGSTTIKLQIANATAYINEKPFALDSPPILYSNDNGKTWSTLIPVRFVSEAFGYNVKYDATNNQIDITSKS